VVCNGQIAKKNRKNYVIKLSTDFSIVTEFTSFVAIEKRDEVRYLINRDRYGFTWPVWVPGTVVIE